MDLLFLASGARTLASGVEVPLKKRFVVPI